MQEIALRRNDYYITLLARPHRKVEKAATTMQECSKE